MVVKMFTVYDSKAVAFRLPMFFNSVGQAVRGFGDIARDKENEIGRHPGDFTLMQIGDFDTETGAVTMLESKINLGSALEHASQENR